MQSTSMIHRRVNDESFRSLSATKSPQNKLIDRLSHLLFCKEAEEVAVQHKNKPFRLSTSLLDLRELRKITIEKTALEQKCGAMWKAIKREPTRWGGYLYTMRLKKRYHSEEAYEEKRKEIYPAIEPDTTYLGHFDPDYELDEKMIDESIIPTIASLLEESEEKIRNDIKDDNSDSYLLLTLYKEFIHGDLLTHKTFKEILSHLGYGIASEEKGICIKLPDQTALTAAWRNEQKKRAHLPDLDVLSSKAIASDIEFIEAYINHDALLSEGQEFVHDHTIHIIPTITRLIEKSGIQKKIHQKKKIVKHYRDLMIIKQTMEGNISKLQLPAIEGLKNHFPILETALAAWIDVWTSKLTSARVRTVGSFFTYGYTICQPSQTLHSYLQRRYGNTLPSDEKMQSMVKELAEFIHRYDVVVQGKEATLESIFG